MSLYAFLLAACVGVACAEPQRAPTIELDRRTVIAGVDDSVDVTFGQPALSTSGFIAVRRLEPPADAIAIYDAAGTYVHTVGRAGGGPGEFQSLVSFTFGPGDSLWAFDGLTAHLFAPPPSQQFVRSFRFDGFVVPVATAYGLLTRPSMTSAGYLYPRLLSWGAAEVLRFVVPDTGSREAPQMGPVALGADRGLWMATEGRYEIVQLGTDGTVARRITRHVEWFPDGVRSVGMPWVKRPAPYIAAISPGPDRLLWVPVRRAHRHWEENRSKSGAISGPPTPRSLSTISPDQIFEGVLEVFDMTTGAFLASREVGGGVLGFVNPRVLYEVIELDSGETRIQLWNFSLSR